MNVLVTGAAGFIGSHLMDRLDKAVGMDKVWGASTVDSEKLDFIIRQRSVEMIVHLGANCSSQISLRNPRVDFTDNVVGTFNVCEAAREYKIPVIFNSTMKVYPGDDGLVPPYGLSKNVGEEYLVTYGSLYGVRYLINRPSSVYGPRQNGSDDGGWVTWFIKAAITGQPITLYGDGTQSRDILYVDDCVDVLVDQINNFDRYEGGHFDFGGGPKNEVSLMELLDFLQYENFSFAPHLPGDVQRFVCENSHITYINGWAPKTDWKEGVRRTMEHFAA